MLRPKQGIKALLAIANPQGLSETFTPINVPQEQELAENALRHVPLTTLTRRGSATLRAIIEGIKEGADIIYLMCHGIVGQQGAVLWLEDEAGNAASVTGEDFAARLGALERIPSLVVLCSCQSAGAGNPARDALVATGPHVSQRGRAGGIGDAGQAFDVCGNAIYPGVFQTAGGAWRSRSRYRQCAGKNHGLAGLVDPRRFYPVE